MKTIYLVTTGCYSDYRVVCGFSTKELAEKMIAWRACEADQIEELVLDDTRAINSGRNRYYVSMALDGSDAKVKMDNDDTDTYVRMCRKHHMRIWGNVWAADELHAIKIVNEQRAQAIAEGMDGEIVKKTKNIESAEVV